MASDEVVDPVADRPRHNDKRMKPGPWKSQAPCDAKRGGRAHVYAPGLDQRHAIRQVLDANSDRPEEGLRRFRLQGRELKPTRRIALDDEDDRAIAEIAYPVEEHDRMGHQRKNGSSLTQRNPRLISVKSEGF